MELYNIDIKECQLRSLPLFLQRIYYNKLSNMKEENKLIAYSRIYQSSLYKTLHNYKSITRLNIRHD